MTDTRGDQEKLQQAFATLGKIKVQLSDELWEDGGNPMKSCAGLEKLRKGHPCWRKLTDPMLLAREGDEVVVVDPDVYFPRRFSFERVGDGTLRLMWQKPSCLLPFSRAVPIAARSRMARLACRVAGGDAAAHPCSC